MRKALVALITIGILAAAGLTAYFLIQSKPEAKKAPAKQTLIGVKTQRAHHQDYTIDITYPGRVEAREILVLSSQVSGLIKQAEVALKIGERFRKGDLLVSIEDNDVRASYKAALSSFLTVLSNSLPDLKIDFPQEYDKWYAFFSNINLDSKLPELPVIATDKEKVYLSSKNILSSYYNLVQKEIVLERYKIYAPFNGAYMSVSKEVGAIATANAELARIVSTDLLEVEVGVSLEDAKILSKGIEVEVASATSKTYKGVIDRISPFVDQSTQRVNVYVLFSQVDSDIVEGELLNITLPSKTLENVIELNREAIVGDTLVYTVKENKLEGAKVKVLAKTATKIYVQGIEPQTIVVGESLVSPYEGMQVRLLDLNGEIIK